MRKRHLTRFELEEAWHRSQEEERRMSLLAMLERRFGLHNRLIEVSFRQPHRKGRIANGNYVGRFEVRILAR